MSLVACEQQTHAHFRSLPLSLRKIASSIFRREISDDRKCVCCWQAMSLEVKPVSNFLVYLAQNCIKRSRTHPNDFRNSFSVHFCTLWHAVNFLWSSNGWKKRSKRRCSEKIKWKSLWFTRQNFQRIECSSVKYKRGRLQFCNERSYRDLKRLEKILEDVKISPTTIIERRVHNKQPNKTSCSSRISPSVSAPSKSLRHAMDQGRTFCFDVIISATIFARRKSAGGNMIGLNQQRKSHASSRSFGGMNAGSFSRTAAGDQAY